jgi:adenine deaminase
MKIQVKLVDIYSRSIFPAEITIGNGLIVSVKKKENNGIGFIMPGLVDAHVHIESSMITPGAFAVSAVKQGTTSVVSDPHEITNVMGIAGINYMIEDGKKSPVKFFFGAPSCVPATNFEESGAYIGPEEIRKLLSDKNIKYLSEMMNYPGVIYGDEEVIEKINIAKKLKKPVDGHAPGLRGEALRKYVEAGISTDHECSSLEEALEKISLGMKILIREGSAARNLDALKDLYITNAESVMLCSDDLHPEMLENRHINKLVALLISEGYDIFDVIRSATINPAEHYKLEAGLLRPGQNADFIIVDSPEEMNVIETWINGKKVFERGNVLFDYEPGEEINNFNCSKIMPGDLKIKNAGKSMRIIGAYNGELLTSEIIKSSGEGAFVETDTEADILKLVVINRYKNAPPATGFINGFGLKKGAFASSVAHDSHNIIAAGTNDEDIAKAINEIVKLKGGLVVSSDDGIMSLPLNVGGIMSNKPCSEVAANYLRLSDEVKNMGCTMSAPFMTLSFMALLVIPDLKLSDRGLFDGRKFCPVPLFVE